MTSHLPHDAIMVDDPSQVAEVAAALERADVGLYEAKHTGKNRTCVN